MLNRGLPGCRWLLYTAICRVRERRDPEATRYVALILLAVFEATWIQLALTIIGAPNLIANRIGHSRASDLAMMAVLAILNGGLLFTRRGLVQWSVGGPVRE